MFTHRKLLKDELMKVSNDLYDKAFTLTLSLHLHLNIIIKRERKRVFLPLFLKIYAID